MIVPVIQLHTGDFRFRFEFPYKEIQKYYLETSTRNDVSQGIHDFSPNVAAPNTEPSLLRKPTKPAGQLNTEQL